MSKKLREQAENASSKGYGALPVLSFEVEPVRLGSLSITAALSTPEGDRKYYEDVGADEEPRLKVKKSRDATIELSVRTVRPDLITIFWLK